MNVSELNEQLVQVSRELQSLIDDHPQYVREEVEADKLATLVEATTRITALADDRQNGLKRTTAEYDAIVAKACLNERFAADLAKGLRESNKLAINAASSRLSAMQSMASAMREELRFARTGPQEGP